MEKKLLLIIAYQLQRDAKSGCPMCGVVRGHYGDCELEKMEKWITGELLKLWKEETEGKE